MRVCISVRHVSAFVGVLGMVVICIWEGALRGGSSRYQHQHQYQYTYQYQNQHQNQYPYQYQLGY